MSEPLPTRLGSRDSQRVRFEAMIDARDGQTRLRVQVLDISASGIRIRTLSPLRKGAKFWVKVPPIQPQEMQVVWIDHLISGCCFTNPLHPSVFAMIVDAAKPDARVIDRRTLRSL